MSKNRSKHIRNKQIILLAGRKDITVKQLAKTFDVSVRTIRRVLKEAGVER